jgi:DNA-directed RNA polymerase sigma subunit (sigma70/sigma32)
MLESKIVHEGKWTKEEADKEETHKLLNRLSPRERELLASHFYLNQ